MPGHPPSRRAGRAGLGRRLRPLALALAGSAVLGPFAPAAAQIGSPTLGYGGLLPDLGADPRVGNLRPQLERLLTPAAPLSARPAWIIQPSIGVDVGVTDNVYQVDSPRRADIFTLISPSIVVSGDTARVNTTLAYSPTATIYASTSSQTQVRQYFDGQVHAIIVPDAVFLDARGNISQQSLTGGYNGYQGQGYSRQNDVQTTTFSITPSAVHRFGGWAVGQISYQFSRSLQDSADDQPYYTNQNGLNAIGRPSYGTLGNLTTQTETGTLTSGENFGRFQDQLSISATQYSGAGSYRGAYRREVHNELNFALTRSITLLSGIGYQDIAYGPSFYNQNGRGYSYSGPTYNLGVRYAPNPDLSLTVQYGSHDGSSDLSFIGTYNPTARIRLSASYSTGITTDLEQAQNYLNTTTVGSGGLVTDTATGAPALNVGYSGLQNGVYRAKRFTASALFLQDRDSWSLSFSNEDRTALTSAPTLLGDAVVPAGTNTNITSVGFGWQHDLAPDMSFSANATYSISTNTGQFIGSGSSPDLRTLTLGAVLSKQFTDTLSGSIRYIFVDQSGGTGFGGTNLYGRGSYTQNTLLVGVRKSF